MSGQNLILMSIIKDMEMQEVVDRVVETAEIFLIRWGWTGVISTDIMYVENAKEDLVILELDDQGHGLTVAKMLYYMAVDVIGIATKWPTELNGSNPWDIVMMDADPQVDLLNRLPRGSQFFQRDNPYKPRLETIQKHIADLERERKQQQINIQMYERLKIKARARKERFSE